MHYPIQQALQRQRQGTVVFSSLRHLLFRLGQSWSYSSSSHCWADQIHSSLAVVADSGCWTLREAECLLADRSILYRGGWFGKMQLERWSEVGDFQRRNSVKLGALSLYR